MCGDIREFLSDLLQNFSDIRIHQTSRSQRNLPLPSIACHCRERLLYFVEQQTHHSHTVLQLQVAVISLFLRHLLLCQHIPLVSRMDHVDPMLLIDLLLPAVDDRKHLPGIFFCKRLQRIQSVPIFCQSYRNDRNTL